MNQDLARILFTEEEIKARTAALGAQISADYAENDPIVIGILKGAIPFFADLFRSITIPCQCDFMGASSYGGGTTTSGRVALYKDASESLCGRHVIVVEDILDTGMTLNFLWKYILEKNPASVRLCVLLDKPSRRHPEVKLKPDYVGFTIPNEFVVGYGLDYAQHYRNLPYIGILDPRIYEK